MAAPIELQGSRPNSGFDLLYQHVSRYKEVASFRRFSPEWAKILHDDVDEVLTCRNEVQEVLEAARVADGTSHAVLNLSRAYVKDCYPEIYEKEWISYEAALKRYGENICLSHNIMNMPQQPAWATKYLASFGSPTFHDGKFGLTQEPAKMYLGPWEETDICSWRGSPKDDFLTLRFIQISPWVEEHILARLRRLCKGPKREEETVLYHHASVIVMWMDILTYIFVSCLLTGAMFALAHIESLNARIAFVGVAGLLFSLSVQLTAGHDSRRVEIFAATAAFFAVASVFVSNNDGGNKHQ